MLSKRKQYFNLQIDTIDAFKNKNLKNANKSDKKLGGNFTYTKNAMLK
ncbi:hypothetical protein SynBIOSU31_03326 [Synechococcus sp. BIOS-U3-1]|nr:hypothetical protein SynBIOSU31_03326 [Synechococcus sp. BIOS-U3-1]